jgi:hypothetical protein
MFKYTIFSAILFFITFFCLGQQQDSLFMARSKKISDRLNDSLKLNKNEYARILTINQSIMEQKAKLMQSTGERSQIARQIQLVENSRDSLYQLALPPNKFERYRQLKPTLLITQ